jgi:hypothetical protein
MMIAVLFFRHSSKIEWRFFYEITVYGKVLGNIGEDV